MEIIAVLPVLMGLLSACCFAAAAVGYQISKSNDLGNTEGEFKDFAAAPLKILKKGNRIGKNDYQAFRSGQK